jgi:hypothetical protein
MENVKQQTLLQLASDVDEYLKNLSEIRCPVPTKIDKQVSDKGQGGNFSWIICVLGSHISVKTLVLLLSEFSCFTLVV